MNKVREILLERKKYLLKIWEEKEKALRDVPDGTLRINIQGQKVQYYCKENNKSDNGVYMRKSKMELVHKLAQKEYDRKVFRAAEKELAVIEKCLVGYPDRSVEDIYQKMHCERQKLIEPVYVPEDLFVKNWETVTYEGKGFDVSAPEFYTAKNERVRSKSEWIIADLLEREGIPYRYEYPLYLKGAGLIHPDFMVLNKRERKEFYWEHLGMMDDVDYVERAMQRIMMYEQNGIYPGKNLILTYETKSCPLSQKMVMNRLEHYLK